MTNNRLQPDVSFVIPVYNDSEQAKKLAVQLTSLENIDRCEIIFVDDGSTDALSPQELPEAIKLVSLPNNCGRAIARNKGIYECSGAYIHFLDVDCEPVENYVNILLAQIANSVDVVFGHLEFECHDAFFQDFENSNQLTRAKANVNWELVQSSACLIVKKELVLAIEGFCTKFNRYGFEDRDFLIRLKQHFPEASYAYAKELTVYHKDDLTLDRYLEKFYASGRYSAPILRQAHPVQYEQTPYSKVDVNTSYMFSKIPKKLISLAILTIKPVLLFLFFLMPNKSKLKLVLFKILKAAAYLAGSIKNAQSQVNPK